MAPVWVPRHLNAKYTLSEDGEKQAKSKASQPVSTKGDTGTKKGARYPTSAKITRASVELVSTVDHLIIGMLEWKSIAENSISEQSFIKDAQGPVSDIYTFLISGLRINHEQRIGLVANASGAVGNPLYEGCEDASNEIGRLGFEKYVLNAVWCSRRSKRNQYNAVGTAIAALRLFNPDYTESAYYKARAALNKLEPMNDILLHPLIERDGCEPISDFSRNSDQIDDFGSPEFLTRLQQVLHLIDPFSANEKVEYLKNRTTPSINVESSNPTSCSERQFRLRRYAIKLLRNVDAFRSWCFKERMVRRLK